MKTAKFKGILDAKPYADVIVCKKECIDYMYRSVWIPSSGNLKKNVKGLDGKGKLTGKLIDDLFIYYDFAICRNPDSIEKMHNNIWTTLYHKVSMDKVPQHKCPSGADS